MKKYKLILLLVVLGFPLLWGIFHTGFFVSDDGHWMVIRLSAFYEALSSGQFPVRFLPRLNQGIGYPVADFLYPLFLYVGSALHVLKIPFLLDIKLILAASILLSGVGMYLYLQKKFSGVASFFGGIFYMYLPYHIYDVYMRGSVGEVVSLAIVPFLFWAIEKKSVILSSIFVSLLILSHNTLALFFFPVAIVYALVRGLSVRSIITWSALGLGLVTFFWLPALFDKQYTIFDSIAVSNPSQYFVNSVSYALVGWIVVALFGGILFVKNSLKDKTFLFFLLVGVISLFMSFSVSSIFWQGGFLEKYVQFPFRFLSLVIFAESFLGAYLIERFKNRILLTTVLILLLFFASSAYLIPKAYDYLPESFYATNTDTTTVQNEYMPKWIKNMPTTYAYDKISLAKNAGVFTIIKQKGTSLVFTVNVTKQSVVQVSFAYFPGWMASVDGKSIPILPSKQGLLQLTVPAGKHSIDVWFGETPLRLFADIISLASLIVICIFTLKRKYV